jgi:NDP-sugar pyrophosphorylase family protein
MEREVFPSIAESGGMAGLVFTGYFVDAGTPASYIEAAQVCIEAGRFSTGEVCCDSWFGDGGSIAEVTGSSIGRGVHIGAASTVENSVVLAGAQIGAGCHISRCIIGEGAILEDGVELVDTVVGHASRA